MTRTVIQRRSGWTRRVRDVMTTSVVTVDRITPYKEIARLLNEHEIGGVPVVAMGRHVVGVVSETDLAAVEDEDSRRARMNAARAGRLSRPARHPRRWGLIAGELMTSPAVTTYPDATIPGAARQMSARGLRRLPVVGPDGTLAGIISRRDLLSVFLRPDPDLAADACDLLDEILPGDPAGITATARDGVVVLTGAPRTAEDRDLVPLATRLIWHIDGVVDVLDKLGDYEPSPPRAPGAPVPRQQAAELTRLKRLHRDPAPVHRHDRAVDEAGTPGGQEHDGLGDLLRRAGTSARTLDIGKGGCSTRCPGSGLLFL